MAPGALRGITSVLAPEAGPHPGIRKAALVRGQCTLTFLTTCAEWKKARHSQKICRSQRVACDVWEKDEGFLNLLLYQRDIAWKESPIYWPCVCVCVLFADPRERYFHIKAFYKLFIWWGGFGGICDMPVSIWTRFQRGTLYVWPHNSRLIADGPFLYITHEQMMMDCCRINVPTGVQLTFPPLATT